MALKKGRRVVPKLTAEPMDVDEKDMDNAHDTVIDVEPLAMAFEPLPFLESPDKSVARLDDLIVEAIRKLNEPSGSNKAVISGYIEDQYWPPADFQYLLSTKLKSLVNSGKLIKVNQKYRIAPSSSLGGISTKMKGMTREEAAAFAAKAVAEAEVAMAEAEEAARVAEAAENDAEAAKAFLDAVILSMRNRNAASMILRAC
uniref:H15 domain-containing protein n=1 Tax=Zea mays TaxID=4577 RepID=A0A804NHE6_MAIZE